MELSNQELVKSLTSLIDETLDEIETIKKSKFAASEISIEGPGDTKIGDKPTNGSLDAKKKEDKEDEDEDKKEKDMDKGENEKADPDHGKFAQAPSVSKGENEKADPDHGKFAQAPTVAKKEEDEEEDEEHEKKESKKHEMKEMKKSISASESLMKSYVDEKFSTLEDRLSKMASAIESLANAPVGRRGVPAGVQALAKSADESETLVKSKVVDQLFELKKSGTRVDSSDIFTAETCKSYGELKAVADKYGVK